jgi:hypothetical protein
VEISSFLFPAQHSDYMPVSSLQPWPIYNIQNYCSIFSCLNGGRYLPCFQTVVFVMIGIMRPLCVTRAVRAHMIHSLVAVFLHFVLHAPQPVSWSTPLVLLSNSGVRRRLQLLGVGVRRFANTFLLLLSIIVVAGTIWRWAYQLYAYGLQYRACFLCITLNMYRETFLMK